MHNGQCFEIMVVNVTLLRNKRTRHESFLCNRIVFPSIFKSAKSHHCLYYIPPNSSFWMQGYRDNICIASLKCPSCSLHVTAMYIQSAGGFCRVTIRSRYLRQSRNYRPYRVTSKKNSLALKIRRVYIVIDTHGTSQQMRAEIDIRDSEKTRYCRCVSTFRTKSTETGDFAYYL